MPCGAVLQGFLGPSGAITCQSEAGHIGPHVAHGPEGMEHTWVQGFGVQPQPQQVQVQLKCPHCHNVLGRWTWIITGDGKLRVYYCEMCMTVLSIETLP